MRTGKGIWHTFCQVLPDVPAQSAIVALSGRAPAILAKGAPQNNHAAVVLPSARDACGHKHVSSWLAYDELHAAETLQGQKEM